MQESRTTFMIVPANGGAVREYRLGRIVVYVFMAALVSVSILSMFFTYGYFKKLEQETLTDLLLTEQERLEKELHLKNYDQFGIKYLKHQGMKRNKSK